MKHTLEEEKRHYNLCLAKYAKCWEAWNGITYAPKGKTLTKNFTQLKEDCKLSMRNNVIKVEYTYWSEGRCHIDEDTLSIGRTINRMTPEELQKVIQEHTLRVEKWLHKYRTIVENYEEAYNEVMPMVEALSKTLLRYKEAYGKGMYEAITDMVNDYRFGYDDQHDRKFNPFDDDGE